MAKFKKHFTPTPAPTPASRTEQAQDTPDFAQPSPTRADLPASIPTGGRKVLDDYRGLYASLPDNPAKTAHMREFAARFCQSAKLDPAIHLHTIIDYLTT